MQIKKIISIISVIFVMLLLQSCASPRMGEELQGGKAKFMVGNYKEAFHDLLPVAVYGRKEAQYAVGYMYYYGLGVAQDPESGLFWMKKSAEQHFAPAVDALKLIH